MGQKVKCIECGYTMSEIPDGYVCNRCGTLGIGTIESLRWITEEMCDEHIGFEDVDVRGYDPEDDMDWVEDL